MTISIKIFFLLAMTAAFINCNNDFSTDLHPNKLSDEDILWLNDADGNGKADSIEKYAPDCEDNENCLTKAKENKEEAETRIKDFLDNANVRFSLPSGTYQKVIEVEIATDGNGTIRYAKNGDLPSKKSAIYKEPIEIAVTTELKARMFLENGDTAGPTQSAMYELEVKTPYATKQSGEYGEPVKVALGCENEKVEIFYTRDGSTPSASSTKFKDSLEIKNTTTIKAIAIKKGWSPSDTLNVHYTINIPNPAAAPVFNPKAGTYSEPQEVSITSETEGAEIRYTLNGEEPDPSSELYKNKISVDKGMTIKAVAIKEGMGPSPISTAEFKIPSKTVAAPVFNPKGGAYTTPQEVSITSETEGAEVRYTLNGEEPGPSSELYKNKISVDKGMTIKAVAMKEGMRTSPVSKAEFNIIPDTLGPSIILLNPSWKDTTVSAADVTIGIKAQDSSGVNSVSVNGKPVPLSEGKYIQNLTLNSGENKITVMAEDKSANKNQSADTLTIAYDDPPAAVELFSPTEITGKGMKIKWSQNNNTDFQAYKIYYSDSPAVSVSDNFAYEALKKEDTSYTFSGLNSNQTYYIKVYVFDKVSSTGSNEVSVYLNSAPLFDKVVSQSVNQNQLLSFKISAKDADGDELAYSMLRPPVSDGRPAFDSGSRTFSWTPTYSDSGNYVAEFGVTDNVKHPGKDTLVVNISVIKVNRDAVVVRKLLDENGFSSIPVDKKICEYTGERITRLYLDSSQIHGQLSSLPADIQNLTKLKGLTLHGNKLTSLPAEIGKLTELEMLDATGNHLTGLPDEIGTLTNLTRLSVGENQISRLPLSIGNLINLSHLIINKNKLSRLPSSIGSLTNLSHLWIEKNQIISLPSGIGKLTKLRLMFASGNKLVNIPEEIGNLVNLTNFDISDNQLSTLPSVFGRLANLRFFTVRGNELTDLPTGIRNLVNIEKLDIGQNQLSQLPTRIVYLKKLTELNVNENKLCDISQTVKKWIDTYTSDPNWDKTQSCTTWPPGPFPISPL